MDLTPPPASIIKRHTLADVEARAAQAAKVLRHVRDALLPPSAKKVAPMLNSADLAELCGLQKKAFAYRATRGDLPGGVLQGTRREWTMEEGRTWARAYRKDKMRPDRAIACTITVANFKGGSTKTTTAVTAAQGLARRGHSVLLIDLDPQGSATSLFGILPYDTEVGQEQTSLPLFAGQASDLFGAVRETYWPGIDLVPAATLLYNAEFYLPARQTKDASFEFWRCLDRGLDAMRSKYDVIVIDTPPSLSYLTINALFAADGVVMPIPPQGLDFASSALFWDLFADLSAQLSRNRGQEKYFEFIDILASPTEANQQASAFVRQWMMEAYGECVVPVEIPTTVVSKNAGAEFGTVYDVARGTMSARTLARARTAYEQMCDFFEAQIQAVWANQIDQIGG